MTGVIIDVIDMGEQCFILHCFFLERERKRGGRKRKKEKERERKRKRDKGRERERLIYHD